MRLKLHSYLFSFRAKWTKYTNVLRMTLSNGSIEEMSYFLSNLVVTIIQGLVQFSSTCYLVNYIFCWILIHCKSIWNDQLSWPWWLFFSCFFLYLHLESTTIETRWHGIAVVSILWSTVCDKWTGTTATATTAASKTCTIHVLWWLAFIVCAIVTVLMLMLNGTIPIAIIAGWLFIQLTPWIVTSSWWHSHKWLHWWW